MSVPARRLPSPEYLEPEVPIRRDPKPPGSPARKPAARPTTSTPPQRRARRGSHRAFWLFAGALTAALLVGIVAINAMVVDATYRLETNGELVRSLVDDGSAMEIEVATLSSPARITDWAEAHGMVRPEADDVVPIRIPGSSGNPG